MSTSLDEDGSAAYHRFRHNARMLGTISSSFDTLALQVSAAYFGALSQPSPQTWGTLVTRTALLVGRANALDGIIAFNAAEREALDFFEAIVRENADLLDVRAQPELPDALGTRAATANPEFRRHALA